MVTRRIQFGIVLMETRSHNHYPMFNNYRLSYMGYVPLHKVLKQPLRHCTSLELCSCSQIPQPLPRAAENPNRTKTNHHPLNHLQSLHTHALNYATLLPTCVSGSSQTPGVKNLGFTSSFFIPPDYHQKLKGKNLDSPSLPILFSYTRNKKKNSSIW